MIQISKRLTSFVWNAAPLTLSGAFDWKSRARILRVINPAGAGYLSFDPSRPANSLTVIATGAVVTLDATGIVSNDPGTFFFVDNGDTPLPLPAPDTMLFVAPAGPAGRQIDYVAMRSGKRANLLAEQSSSATNVVFSINGGPYVSDAVASQQIAALPTNTFGVDGPGYTVKPRLLILAQLDDEDYRRYTFQQIGS